MGPGNVGMSMVHRNFLFITESDIENYQDCSIVVGSSDMLTFRSSNASSLVIYNQQIVYFFSSCMYILWEEYESEEGIIKWSC